jgi:hypothetical protein
MNNRSVIANGSQSGPLAYFGHHKCASLWILGHLESVSAEIGLKHSVVTDRLAPQSTGLLNDSAGTFCRADLRRRVTADGVDLVSCLAADRLQAEVLAPSRAFHVIRDPRDIIVSAYFSHRNSHPTAGAPHMQAHRAALRAASPKQGLFLEMEFSRTELFQLRDWDYTNPSVLELRTEDLTLQPYEGFLRIFRHLGLLSDTEPVRAVDQVPVWISRLLNRLSRRPWLGRLRRRIPATGEIVLGTVYGRRFEAQTAGRPRGREDVTSHYRKGTAGDWMNHFTVAHAEAFIAHFGDLLVRLGYEGDADWVSRCTAQL